MSILRTIRRRYSTLGEGVGEGDKGRGSLPIYPSLPSRIRPLPLPFRFVWQNKQTKKKKILLHVLSTTIFLDFVPLFGYKIGLWYRTRIMITNTVRLCTLRWHSVRRNKPLCSFHSWVTFPRWKKKCCFEIGVSFNYPSLVVVLFFGGELFLLLRPITNPYWVFITRFNIIIHAD